MFKRFLNHYVDIMGSSESQAFQAGFWFGVIWTAVWTYFVLF